MAEYLLKKSYLNHFGIDLKSSDLTRPIQFASGMKNAQYRKSGAVEKRKGFQAHSASKGGFGLFTYERIDPDTGLQVPQVVAVSTIGHKLVDATMTVTYSGSDPTCLMSIFYDVETSQYRAQILEGAVFVLDKALGLGFDEASPVAISSLVTDINALTGFAATTTGETTVSASFFKIVRDHDLAASTLTATAGGYSDINSPLASPFAGSETNKNADNFENVSSVQINNVLYLSNGYDEVQKYDGQTLYRSGVPEPATVTNALVAAGSITGTTYVHLVQYQQVDAVGNITEGNFLKTDPPLSPTAESFDVTVANILASSGFNTDCAIVAGLQAVVNTITVDDGSGGSHTMEVGDKAYFFDTVSAANVTRNVTAIAAGTITVDGAAVTVSDNVVISNNLKINIFRSKSSATTPESFFLVDEIPNNSFTATQVYNDDIVDASLGAQFIEPLTDRSTPPKGKYISSFSNQTIIAGNIEFPNTVFFADVDGPEFFPAGSNNFRVDTILGDIITGISPTVQDFAIFKQKSIHIMSGDIANVNLRVSLLTGDIGCIAHATIKEARGLLGFLSDRGPFFMQGSQIPQTVGGDRIEPMFDVDQITEDLKQMLFNTQVTDDNQKLMLKRAVAINDRTHEKYIIYIPTESEDGSSDKYANSDSQIIAYDYTRDAWLLWDNMNMAGGVTTIDGEFLFSERRASSFTSNVEHILYRRHSLNDAFDYQDNNEVVTWNYDSQWEPVGEPSVLKKYLSLRVFALEALKNNDVSLDVKTEVNYIKDSAKSTFTVSLGVSGYGVSAYSTTPYGDPAENAVISKLSTGRFKSLRLRYSNINAQQNTILTGWELEIATPYRREFKK
ncbi:hypothetical protein GOV11_04125 [Candidatus Woesearchaeota archaeon]|nr:hypothetical protein [Candidatus Woesearchaeota archaeon]